MSSRQRPKQIPYLGRSVHKMGEDGAGVVIPEEVRKDIGGLETGRDGDVVDLEFDREDGTLTIFLTEDE